MYKNFSRKAAYVSKQKAKEGDYWLNRLSGDLVKAGFPCDKTGKPADIEGRVFDTDTVEFALKGDMFTRLMKLRNQSDHLLHMILTAAVIILLQKYSYRKNRDIIVGSPIYRQEIQGEFINTVLPLRVFLAEGITFKDLLIQVKQVIMEAVDNQNYPLESMLYHLGIPYTPGDDFPLLDVAVLLENIHDKAYLEHIHVNVTISFCRQEEGINGALRFNRHLYEQSQVMHIKEHLLYVLDQCLDNINLPVASVELLTEQERQQLLEEFNGRQIPFAREETLAALFEQQVEKVPDRVAVEDGCVQLSYRDLNRRSQRLARLLRQTGVTPDSNVGIMVERSVDTVIGIMAILKAGAAYLPIDPETPLTRSASILEESVASMVLAKNASLDKFAFTGLQGLRRSGVKPVFTPPRPPIANLDSLPFPDRSLIDYSKYNQYIGQSTAKNIIVVQASRGCPYQCAYCHKIWPKKQVFRSAEHIFSEIKLNVDMGMRKLAFVDDIFNLDRETSMKFFRMVIDQGLDVQFYFPNGLRGDILTKEYIDLMVEAGTVSMALALETGSPRLQKLIRKNLNLEKFQENIRYISETYPQVILELFTMFGFPSETEEDALMTLNFIKGVRWIHFPYINVLKIYPNTDMEQLAIEQGITRESILRSENFAHFEVSDSCPLDKNFTLNYRADFLHNYFMCKERLLHVLPLQMKLLTRDEIVQKYNSYLPTEIPDFEALLSHLDIEPGELTPAVPLQEDTPSDFHLRWQERSERLASGSKPSSDGLRILLLDLSQFFSKESDFFYDVMGEAPLGMLYLLTYLNHCFGNRITGKIAKSRIDFDSYMELKTLVKEFKPDVIGVRSLSIYKDFFHKTISLLRQWGIDVPIVAGGPYPTSDIATVLQDAHVDIVVPGEGEITFSEIIAAIMNHSGTLPPGEELMKIPGIAFIPRETKAVKIPASPGVRKVILTDIGLTEASLANTGDESAAGKLPEQSRQVNRSGHLAYTIFTSGSTGRPKGVMIEQRQVHYLVQGLKERIYRHYPGYLKVSMVSPFVFDASVKQIFGALLQGHGLCIVPEPVRVDVERLFGFYLRHHIDIADGTPAHISMLTEALKESPVPFFTGNFLIGGETLPRQTVLDFFNSFTCEGLTPKITNVYGPTECSVDSTAYEVSGETIDWCADIPVGSPLPNCRVYVIDCGMNLLPTGIPGELCIAGAGVGRGYLNDPELTATKFTLDPFEPNSRMYCTGDLGKWLPSGDIVFVGRKDLQVKVRGFRIEPEEIEQTLLRHNRIKETVVIVKGDIETDKFLCAYFTVGSGSPAGTLDVHDLKEYLSFRLPEYMIPTHFVQLEKFPLTGNGKINRRELAGLGIETGSRYLAPRDRLEEQLVDLFAGVLGIEKDSMGIEHDFFEMGGHSLKATILIARLHKTVGIKIPLAELFRSPRVRELAAYVRQTAKNETGPQFNSIPRAPDQAYYPLTSPLRRLYFEQQADLQGTAYNIFAAVTLTGKLNRQKMGHVFRQIIRRQETLRTTFHLVNNEPMMKIHEEVNIQIDFHDSPDHRDFLNHLVRPFDLSNAPLLRLGLVETGTDQYILMVCVHHMVADGTSIGLMIKEFIALYQDQELPPLPVRYRDFSMWQNQDIKEKQEEEEKKKMYWQEQFKGEIPVLELPYDFPRPREKSTEGAVLRTHIGTRETRQIKDFASQEDVTLFMIMMGLFYVFLSRLSGQEDIIVGTPLAGRVHTDLEPIIGMFVNTLAIRNFPSGDKTFRHFLKEVKERTLQAIAHQDYGVETLVKELLNKRSPDRNPLFDVLLAVQNMEIPGLDIPGLQIRPYEFQGKTSRFDMSFHIWESNARLSLLVEYSTRLFKLETIERFLENFKEVIAAVMENPDIYLRDIAISTEVSTAKPGVPLMDLEF